MEENENEGLETIIVIWHCHKIQLQDHGTHPTEQDTGQLEYGQSHALQAVYLSSLVACYDRRIFQVGISP